MPCFISFLVQSILHFYALFFGLTTATTAGTEKAVLLTRENFDAITKDKNVFINFYQTGCGHFAKLMPEWEKMDADWKGHELVFIGAVNCHESPETERWCWEDMEILGLPALLFGDASQKGQFLQSYGGDRSYASLAAFVNETLTAKAMCSPGRPEACDDTTEELIRSFWRMSVSELEGLISSKEQLIDDTKDKFKTQYEAMQKKYDQASTDLEESKATIKDSIHMMKNVAAFKSRV
jgi:thiol-disulfide isomerase/thioredoxin